MGKKIREQLGQVFAVRLENSYYGFGQVTGGELYTFFNFFCKDLDGVQPSFIVSHSILFRICVAKRVLTNGEWPVIGIIKPTKNLLLGEDQYKVDPLNGKLTIWKEDNSELPATWEECKNLERAAIWDKEHVEERLYDSFCGRPSAIVEAQKPPFARDKSVYPD